MLVALAASLVLCHGAWAQYDDEPVEAQPVDEPMPEPQIVEEPQPAPQEELPPPPPAEAPQAEEPAVEEPAPAPAPVMPTVRPSRPRPGIPSSTLPPRPRPARPGIPGSPNPNVPANATPAPGGDAGGVLVNNGEDNGAKATDAVNFDYRDAPLNTVIESIAKLTGKNFDVDPNIGAVTVTVITHDKIPPEMAYQVLESILASRGFSMEPALDGNLIKIRPTPDIVPSPGNPLKVGTTSVEEKTYDDYSTHVIQVQHADPSELANALKILGSQTARIDVYVPTNTMIITDTANGLRRMFAFLEQADIPGQETAMEIYQLTYTRAEIISQQIEQVLLDEGAGRAAAGGAANRAPAPAPQRAPARGRPTVPGQSNSQVIGSNEEVLRMVTDERLNSLIVVATSGMMEKVRDLVERLDTPTPYEANTLHIYELLNAEAEQVEEALQGLVGGGGSRGSSRRNSTQQRRNTQGGQQQAAAQNTQRPAGGTGGSNAADVQPFEQAVQITRYDQTNSLLIVCSPQDWKLLESVIARLDVRQRQVHVDAVVMDVTMNDSYSVEVDAAGLENENYFGLTGTQQIGKLAAGLSAAAGTANGVTDGETPTPSIPTAATLAGSLIGLGSGGGLTTGVFDDLEFEVDGQTVKVPFVPLLFQAIESITDLEVLSQPSLVTVDNEEASITVGQEVPYVTSQGRTQLDEDGRPQSSGFYGGFNQVQREDVGVKLKVTPQISEGESVLLEMELEISDTDANQIGDVNLLGPTLNKSLVTNKVLVRDGSTAVMAGLIRDTNTRKRSQPPVLGDIPVVGWLFRSKANTHTKRNMVVLVTPTIIKEGQHHDRVTEYKVDEYHQTNLSALWEGKGFFKKVKKKADTRKKSRPTMEKTEQLLGERNSGKFGKGDIKR